MFIFLHSRPSLKKYVKANNKTAEGPTFDKLFNNALAKGVAKGLFAQPKGKQSFILGVSVATNSTYPPTLHARIVVN